MSVLCNCSAASGSKVPLRDSSSMASWPGAAALSSSVASTDMGVELKSINLSI